IPRRPLLAGGGLAAAALLGCSGNNNNGNKATTVPTTAGTQARTTAAVGGQPSRTAAAATQASGTRAAAQPRGGGTVQLVTTLDLPHLDPQQTAAQTLASLGPGLCYSRLVHLDSGPNGTPKNNAVPQADAAESWEQVDDLTSVFHLRRGVKFFNIAPVNGRELTAQDVVYSFGRQQQLKVTGSFLGPVTSVTAPDQYTVRLGLSRANADHFIDMADTHNKIVAREAVEAKGDLKQPPVVATGA